MKELKDIVLNRGDKIYLKDNSNYLCSGAEGNIYNFLIDENRKEKEISKIERPIKYETIYEAPKQIDMEKLLSKKTIRYLTKKIMKYLYCNEPVKGIVVHKYISSATGKIKRYAELILDEHSSLMLSGNKRWENLEEDKEYTLKELGLFEGE